jgi:hypothetical protein
MHLGDYLHVYKNTRKLQRRSQHSLQSLFYISYQLFTAAHELARDFQYFPTQLAIDAVPDDRYSIEICSRCAMFEIEPTSGKGLVCKKFSMGGVSPHQRYRTVRHSSFVLTLYFPARLSGWSYYLTRLRWKMWMSTPETCSMVQVVRYLGSGRPLPLRAGGCTHLVKAVMGF